MSSIELSDSDKFIKSLGLDFFVEIFETIRGISEIFFNFFQRNHRLNKIPYIHLSFLIYY